MNQSELMRPIGEKVYPLLERYEYIISLFALLAIILHYLHISPAGILLNLVLSTYAVVIFLCAFVPALPEEESQLNSPKLIGFINFVYRLMWLSCSVGLISILYNLSHWPGGEVMGNISVSSCGICLLAMLILQFGFNIKCKAHEPRHYYRVAILLIFSLYFTFQRSQLFV
jgi:hypothetical protein